MSTNLEIIEAALREINVISETKSASPEQGKKGLRNLNQMMEVWKEDDVDFGWFKQSLTTDTAPIPDYAEVAVELALALMIAPNYGATLSAESVAKLDAAWTKLLRKSISEKLSNADMSHMPQGTGKFGYGYDINTDA